VRVQDDDLPATLLFDPDLVDVLGGTREPEGDIHAWLQAKVADASSSPNARHQAGAAWFTNNGKKARVRSSVPHRAASRSKR